MCERGEMAGGREGGRKEEREGERKRGERESERKRIHIIINHFAHRPELAGPVQKSSSASVVVSSSSSNHQTLAEEASSAKQSSSKGGSSNCEVKPSAPTTESLPTANSGDVKESKKTCDVESTSVFVVGAGDTASSGSQTTGDDKAVSHVKEGGEGGEEGEEGEGEREGTDDGSNLQVQCMYVNDVWDCTHVHLCVRVHLSAAVAWQKR